MTSTSQSNPTAPQTAVAAGVAQFGEVRDIPLNRLKASPNNVRRVGHRPEAIESRAATIGVKGVLQPPVVEPEIKNGKETGYFLVTAGEGRRQALRLLAKRKALSKAVLVRCIVDTTNDPAEVSLDENISQETMHPADQYEAFKDLAERKGYGPEEIAARFGVKPVIVRQRLRLGMVAPALLDLYREAVLTLDQITAFAVNPDPDRQVAVYTHLPAHDQSPRTIRRLMTEHKVATSDRRVRFVGLEAYVAAGGPVLSDLFFDLDGGWIEDAGLLDRLVNEKLAVDHWNTEHPHVHVLVRGVGEDGQDLVIDRDYIARGLRQRAEALVSLELGPRTPAEVAASLDREVEAERWTSLDRKLRDRRGPEGWVDLRPGGQADRDQRRLIGRAQTLEKLGLAEGQGGCWRLDEDLEARLRALGERGDIIKTLHAAWRGERDPADLHIGGTDLDAPLIGRLTDRGLHDELSGQAYVVVDGADGRLHYFRFRDLEASGDTPVGGLVEIRVRQVDGAKAGLELVHRADMRIERQVTASGATWLDRQLVVKDPAVLATRGFGRDVRDALEARRAHLQTLGLADASGRPRPGLLASLRTQELQRVAGNITAAGGGAYSEAASGDAVQGVYGLGSRLGNALVIDRKFLMRAS